MRPRRSVTPNKKSLVVWHTETCRECGSVFEELSDPRTSWGLCQKCLEFWFGGPRDDVPLQKPADADDWWIDFVYQYERDRALGLIDASGKQIKPG